MKFNTVLSSLCFILPDPGQTRPSVARQRLERTLDDEFAPVRDTHP